RHRRGARGCHGHSRAEGSLSRIPRRADPPPREELHFDWRRSDGGRSSDAAPRRREGAHRFARRPLSARDDERDARREVRHKGVSTLQPTELAAPAPSSPPLRKRVKRYLRFLLVRAALAIVSSLPLRFAAALGRAFGSIAFALAGGERRKALDSLSRAF